MDVLFPTMQNADYDSTIVDDLVFYNIQCMLDNSFTNSARSN